MVTVEQDGAVLTVALNRPESHNAMNPEMIGELTAVFHTLSNQPDVRVVVLTGNGRSFCAGADLNAMRAAADYTFAQNVADGEAIFDLMAAVDSCPKPVIGRINGAAIGGGVGLVSCCDMVVAVQWAKFAFSEARLGIVPAVISPFVLAKIGVGNGRELFLTGERFDAQRAKEIGLVNYVVPEEELDAKVAERVAQLLLAAPGAQTAVKDLIRTVAYQPKTAVRDYTSSLIAQRRASDEGREGMSAFLEKRKPNWQLTTDH
ncbi:MAG: enoyl-CoA hydratase/isomerase family protein [Ardenticatenaceae bacterium]|nr:enoyl-CoA hydratase/isomerase family protein [Anaerolineales bacterium]MCB8922002.1 enoyl-CoA hydratase/isomerase family protein [Ardenticatenaceae bacterium]MCB8989578.1 enoyl-CoA hydratase/isomerase family protein [Ardenticatenaceae bacterium]MCB9003121.1 enoyl-CoA hydratase/isomerase family protein [Ardenticatenaceae bacterium]